jgi:hypothetical protein
MAGLAPSQPVCCIRTGSCRLMRVCAAPLGARMKKRAGLRASAFFLSCPTVFA